MKPQKTDKAAEPTTPDARATVPALVGRIYAEASPAVRSDMLEHLLKPLGVLSLVAVANGVFAPIVMRDGMPRVQVRAQDVQLIEPQDVVSLVHYVQQVSSQVFEGLVGIVLSAPMLADSASFALLMAMLQASPWALATTQGTPAPH